MMMMYYGIVALVIIYVAMMFCQKKELFQVLVSQDFSFTPYFMSNTLDVSHRGCEAAKYWNCVNAHPLTAKQHVVGEIEPQVVTDCKKYSDEQCAFPALVSHSRKLPYLQELHFV